VYAAEQEEPRCRCIPWPQVNAATRAKANLILSRFGSAPCAHHSRIINPTLWRATYCAERHNPTGVFT
jgi:hypothetical protein